MFCGGRVIMGFGTSAALAVALAHLQEIAHPRYRAPVSALSSVCLGSLDIVGEMAWRIPAWCQCIGPVITLLLTASMPESPRWLVKRGRLDEARNILVKYHVNGKEDDALVVHEFGEICSAITEEQNIKQVSYSDFLKTPGNRHRLLILFVQGQGPYYANLTTPARLQVHSNSDPMAGPNWNGKLADIHADYLANGGKLLSEVMEADAAVVKKMKDVLGAFNGGDAKAKAAIEAELARL
ncbi:uncharacterized protein N7483_009675 [Penicillium malachiteum]|uniref:uncharacterized protein n=1 Tax=Penicillium malachiteum TaxID=1324776 RepID=UPI002547C0B9|nr:uncharacterized protein N7483_009675 [Penicillium malachiteum]KAJ5721741.1 hypothetical protein N7483_009675 [Penicillium malachiteum]